MCPGGEPEPVAAQTRGMQNGKAFVGVPELRQILGWKVSAHRSLALATK